MFARAILGEPRHTQVHAFSSWGDIPIEDDLEGQETCRSEICEHEVDKLLCSVCKQVQKKINLARSAY